MTNLRRFFYIACVVNLAALTVFYSGNDWSLLKLSGHDNVVLGAHRWDSSHINGSCELWSSPSSSESHVKMEGLCTHAHITNYSPDIVMFTTGYDNIKRRSIHRTTFSLWSQLPIQPVLFLSQPSKDKYLLDEACNRGWDVYIAPYCNGYDLPVLKSMFQGVMQEYPDAHFVGYANSDMQFDFSLIETLGALDKYSPHVMPKMLAVGRRIEIKKKFNTSIETQSELSNIQKTFGSRGFVTAVDYFISRPDFPWASLPPVVVGRRAYDNFLVYKANKLNYSTIDLSDTVRATHLGGTEPYAASHSRKGASLNVEIAGNFDFTQGLISCANLRTQFEGSSVAVFGVTSKGFCGQGHWGKRHKHFGELMNSTKVTRIPVPAL